MGRTERRIILYVLLPASLMYFGLRFYAQFRHIDVYVARVAPMPVELASQLHMEEHKIDPLVRIESLYAKAPEKILSLDEISRLRAALAWNSAMPVLADSLTILSTTNALARRNGKTWLREYHLRKHGTHWTLESATRTRVQSYRPD